MRIGIGFILLGLAWGACRTSFEQACGGQATVHRITGQMSQAYVVETKDEGFVLVDALYVTKRDQRQLDSSLRTMGLTWSQLRAVIITHAHADHAGQLAYIVRHNRNASIVLGAGDLPLLRAQGKGHTRPATLPGRLLRPLVGLGRRLAPIPDSLLAWQFEFVEAGGLLSLQRFGLDGYVYAPAPPQHADDRLDKATSHTPGSLSVLVRASAGDSTSVAFVGDLFRGKRRAKPHYFYEDKAQAFAHIQRLLKRRPSTFYLGHGGPHEWSAVAERFGAD